MSLADHADKGWGEERVHLDPLDESTPAVSAATELAREFEELERALADEMGRCTEAWP